MAKIEPFPCAILLPKEVDGDFRSPGLRLSLATRFEEPDLRAWHREGYAEGMLHESNRVLLPDLRAEGALTEVSGKTFLLAKSEGPHGRSIALYCRYPAKAVRELFNEHSAAIGEPDPDYLSVLRHNAAVLDPLHLALSGYQDEDLTPILDFGQEVAEQNLSDGVRVTYRAISDQKEIKLLHKLFDPGIFSRAEAMILDGPIALAKWQAHSRREFIYAALIPVSASFGRMEVGEMIWDRRALPKSPAAAAPLSVLVGGPEAEPERKPLPEALKLPSELRLLRHYFSSSSSREYALVDFEEDLRIESRIADVSALMVRDRDEFGVVIGQNSRSPLLVAELVERSGLFTDAQRIVVDGDARAAQLYAGDFGFAAAWMPRREGVDYTQRLFQRRPAIASRRVLARLNVPIPFGSVVHVGL